MGATDAAAGSMDAATLALKTRLAAQGGTDEQWELLAQSYDFLGRTVEAKLAREHKTSAAGALSDAMAASVALLPARRSATVATPVCANRVRRSRGAAGPRRAAPSQA